ncbi:unnamed protein product [Coregonus sp. 'balchen']|nr:unnamed protein product [Coregonus sp. 'balchen']
MKIEVEAREPHINDQRGRSSMKVLAVSYQTTVLNASPGPHPTASLCQHLNWEDASKCLSLFGQKRGWDSREAICSRTRKKACDSRHNRGHEDHVWPNSEPAVLIGWLTTGLDYMDPTKRPGPGQAPGIHMTVEGNLVIQDPVLMNSGIYKCNTKNALGSDFKATYLQVI